MADDFHVFAKAVRRQFDAMAKDALFVVASDRDAIWAAYMAAFPAGSNPVFRQRTEHDCACCRAFIRSVGNVVGLKDGVVTTVWDVTGLPAHYQEVADRMAAHIRALPIRDVFLVKQARQGTEKSIELVDGKTLQWNHFSVDVPRQFISQRIDEVRGALRTTHAVMLRGMRELTPAAVATVRELIRENAIYRGAEHKRAVEAFATLQARFAGINDPEVQERLAWALLAEAENVARFRNTAIGTLVQDLSEGKDLEAAVRSFEAKVAPQNYKRPTALITKSMVEAATKTIAELGLEDALERRHARLRDVSVDSVYFVDNAVQGEMKGGIKGLLMEAVTPPAFDPSRAEEINVTDFISKLPAFTGLQLYVENIHAPNFVSLTAPVYADASPLFSWGNGFGWSYDGNVTDSIKERVKRAGGRVENVALRVSLAWYNTDDLDLHCHDPHRGHVYYGNKSGILDVDMNVHNYVRDPVENMRWVNTPKEGVFTFFVDQFSRRESVDVGFTVEVETAGGITTLSRDKSPASGARVEVAQIEVQRSGVMVVKPGTSMKVGTHSQEKWGLRTQELVRVNSVVLSPNHWGGAEAGNKHWFFILEGCYNPEPTRGIYNEFLRAGLQEHRKVFEVLGDKTKCPPAPEQLSGLGFSSTRKDKATVLATGPKLNKVYTVVFGEE